MQIDFIYMYNIVKIDYDFQICNQSFSMFSYVDIPRSAGQENIETQFNNKQKTRKEQI